MTDPDMLERDSEWWEEHMSGVEAERRAERRSNYFGCAYILIGVALGWMAVLVIATLIAKALSNS